MRKVKFALQVTVLLMAFPVWFFAEMKRTDETVKNNRVKSQDSATVKKAIIKKVENSGTDIEFISPAFSNLVVVYN